MFPQNGAGQAIPNLGPLDPRITLADQMRLERQGKVIRQTGCVADCGGTDLTLGVPLFFENGVPRNARVRCLLCLTLYEVTPDGKVVNIRHATEVEGKAGAPTLEKA